MRVLLITPFYRPGIGGSSRLLENIVDAVVAEGGEADVLTFASGSTAESDFDSARPYRMHRVPSSGMQGWPSVRMLWTAIRVARRHRPDLVFCGTVFPSAVLGAVTSLVTRIPLASYCHGEDIAGVVASPRKARIARWAITRSAAVFVNSRYTGRVVQQVEPSANVVLSNPWITTEPFLRQDATGVADLRTRLRLPEDSPIVLTVARLEERKGHDTVIRALPAVLERHPTTHYLIIGSGDTARLDALAGELGVAEHVSIVAGIAEADLPLAYQLADVHIMLSRRDRQHDQVEGFGMVYLEASASGTPSISGDEGGCPDAVEDHVTGLIVPVESAEAAADALCTLLDDSRLAGTFGAQGRARVLARFDATVRLPEQVAALEALSLAPTRQLTSTGSGRS